jgi:hypothetical protein
MTNPVTSVLNIPINLAITEKKKKIKSEIEFWLLLLFYREDILFLDWPARNLFYYICLLTAIDPVLSHTMFAGSCPSDTHKYGCQCYEIQPSEMKYNV